MKSSDTEPTPLNPPPERLPDEHRKALLAVARQSILHGLEHGCPLPVAPESHASALRAIRATFVTLELNGDLRGCIGSLEASRPLVVDVAQNAYAAAFRDPRFRPVTQPEAEALDIHISVLSPLEEMTFQTEEEFVAQLRPGVDGIVLQEGYHCGTFLPSVWEQLPGRKEFVAHLKMKAGLPPDYWSPRITALRYTTDCFP